MQNRINHLIELQELQGEVYHKSQNFQERMKYIFDRKVKKDNFHTDELVLKWDARIEDKGKHGKFDHLWQGPYKISTLSEKNANFLQDSNVNAATSRPINGRFLKH